MTEGDDAEDPECEPGPGEDHRESYSGYKLRWKQARGKPCCERAGLHEVGGEEVRDAHVADLERPAEEGNTEGVEGLRADVVREASAHGEGGDDGEDGAEQEGDRCGAAEGERQGGVCIPPEEAAGEGA